MVSFNNVNPDANGNQRSNWQKHHIVPKVTQSFTVINQLVSRISNNLDSQLSWLQYGQEAFDFNGLLLPNSNVGSTAYGFGKHAGQHPQYTDFVGRIISEIIGEYDANITGPNAITTAQAAEIAARTLRGFQAHLIDSLTVSSQTNAITGENIARSKLFVSPTDPWVDGLNVNTTMFFDNFTLDTIRGGVNASNPNMSLPFWQGYLSEETSFQFGGFDYAERFDTIYDPYFTYTNGVHASSVERFVARQRDVTLDQVTDFVDLRLGEFLSDIGDLYSLDAVVLDDVVFFQPGADHSQTIAQLTARIGPGLEIDPDDKVNTLVFTGDVTAVPVDLAHGPNGDGLVVTPPSAASFAEFINISDELAAVLPDWLFTAEIREALDDIQSYVGHRVAEVIGDVLGNIQLPQFTVAKDGIGGHGYTGTDLMLGLGTAELTGAAGGDWIIHFGSGEAHGGVGDDKVFGINSEYNGPADRLDLYGGDGDDIIGLFLGHGGFLHGGAGDDFLIAGGGETHFYGGDGFDTFHIGANTTIHDAEVQNAELGTGDRLMMGIPIWGGAKQWWMEGNTAYWAPFSTLAGGFPVIGSSLITAAAFSADVAAMKFASFQRYEDGGLGINIGYGLGGVAKIENYQLDLDTGRASAGVVVFETNRDGNASLGGDTQKQELLKFINLALKAGFGVGFQGWDPIVLDLDGDGYELTTLANSSVYFEFDGDGFAEQSGWVRPDDGFLVLDANTNGIVDDATEFFGDETQAGFVELATHDGNADGVIDASDAVFSQLQVWRDLDGDGETDAGELFSMADLGIASISLMTATPETGEIGGNLITAEGAVTLIDGSTIKAGDVVLDISQVSTEYLGATTVSGAAAVLPELRGFGTVADLRIAMSEDAGLLNQVQAFDALTTTDLSVLKADAEAILYTWADVDGVAADPIGTGGFDARKLAFLETFAGQEIAPRDPQTGDVLTSNVGELETLWADTLESLTLRLVVQASGLSQFAGLNYDEGRDLILIDGAVGLAQVYTSILSGLSAAPGAALAEWEEWGELLRALHEGARRFDNNLVREDFAAAQLEAAIMSSGTTLTLAELAPALGIDNLTIGTAAAETLTQNGGGTIFSDIGNGDIVDGGGGQDVYLLKSGFGNVVIDDVEGSVSGDRIRFIDVNKDGVTTERVGDDLVITVTATRDTVTILGQFADVIPLSADVVLSDNRGIEEIQFADGGLMELPDIAIAVGEGMAGDDLMEGTMHTDVFQGRAGNDTLKGGDDADLYVFDAGDGSDTIIDQQTNPLLRAADMLIFGDGIAPDDITFSRAAGDANDLLITIGATGDSILIDGQFSYGSLGYNHIWSPNSRIELFAFRHYGDTYSAKDIQQKIIEAETTDGDDVTTGFGDDDIFYASAGNDTLIGSDGADTYFWGGGFGNDIIDEQAYYIDVNVGLGGLSLEHGADTIVFAPDIAREDIVFSRLSADAALTITLTSTGETLTVLNQFAGFQTGVLGAQWMDRVEWFEFGDGTRLSWQDILFDVTTGTAGDDSLWGDLTADTLTGGLGDDFLSGLGSGDRYVYALGDGHDTIQDANNYILGSGFVMIDSSPDILELGSGITENFLTFTAFGGNVTITIDDPSDPNDLPGSVTLVGQNSFIQTGVFGAFAADRIEELHFDDGIGGTAILTADQINERVIAGATTSGDDLITGFTLADRFLASAGNDTMRGLDSGDLYEFGFGSGNDRIEEGVSHVLYGDEDVVEFGAGITAANLSYSRVGNDLTITLNDGTGTPTGDTLTIAGQFEYSSWFTWYDVELFRFEDGTELTKADIVVELLQSSPDNDHLIGTSGSETLSGGLGDDLLEGGNGDDRYEFSYGDGDDIIREPLHNAGGNDVLAFDSSVTLSDIDLVREGADLHIVIANGAGGSIVVEQQFSYNTLSQFWADIEAIEFYDASNALTDTLTQRDIIDILTTGDANDNNIMGSGWNDTIDGGAGNDVLSGADGGDTYLFGIGGGHDRIIESFLTGTDTILFGSGILASDLSFSRVGDDLVITLSSGDSLTIQGQLISGNGDHSIEEIRFTEAGQSPISKLEMEQLSLIPTDFDDVLSGGEGDNTIDGGWGDDVLIGNAGADHISGDRGDDTLHGGIGGDTYYFGIGDGNDLLIDHYGTRDIISTDTLVFEDGLKLSDLVVTQEDDGRDLLISLKNGADSILLDESVRAGHYNQNGWNRIEFFVLSDENGDPITYSHADLVALTVQPTEGNDTLTGAYDGTYLEGGGGDDLLLGYSGPDTLVGGTGNDVLQGGRGDDIYRFNIGDGSDTIRDVIYQIVGTGFDTIEFGPGILPQDIVLSGSLDPADLTMVIAGTGDQITIEGMLYDGDYQIEQAVFEDGTIWTKQDMLDMLVTGTAGDDQITGSHFADDFDGGTGNDTLEGGPGNDIYNYDPGDGDDIISDYTYYWGSWDVLRFGAGISPADIQFSTGPSDTSDMVISFVSQSGSITLDNQVFGGDEWRIDQVEFADGTIWDAATLLANYLVGQGTSGDDFIGGDDTANTLNGGAGNDDIKSLGGDDTLAGGRGDDRLEGGLGADIYSYDAGDGDDVILDAGGTRDNRLVFGSGITPADVAISGDDNDFDKLIVTFLGQPGSITIEDQWTTNAGVEFFDFADGTTWDEVEIRNRYDTSQALAGNDTVTGTTGPDTLEGFGGNDVLLGDNGDDMLIGGTGNDLLHGGDGSDTYVFSAGDGSDTIDDNGWIDNDRLLIHGYAPGDVSVAETAPGSDDALLTFAGSTDQITIIDTLNGTGNDYLEQIVFDDGTIWTPVELRAMIVAQQQTTGDDVITGFVHADTLEGGLGNDTLHGGDGSDTYVFSAGDGSDTIDDNGWIDNDRLLIHGYAPGDVSVAETAPGSDDALLTFAGSTDQITIIDTLNGTGNDYLEQIVFDDGTIWTPVELRAMIVAQQQTTGDDVITGFVHADTLEGGLGNDTLHGGDGSDTYVFSAGDGSDTIDDNGWIDNDRLLIHGYAPGDVSVAETAPGSDDALLTFAGSTDQITIIDTLNGTGNDYLEQIVFDDGTIWTPVELRAMIVAQQQTTGDDVITGFVHADTLEGGLGNDTLHGGDGSDTYVFSAGDGSDTIDDNGWIDNDRLLIHGYAPGDVTAVETAPGSMDVLLTFAGSSDQIVIIDTYNGTANDNLEQIIFDDGSIWTPASLIAASQSQSGASSSSTFFVTESSQSNVDTMYLQETASGETYLDGYKDLFWPAESRHSTIILPQNTGNEIADTNIGPAATAEAFSDTSFSADPESIVEAPKVDEVGAVTVTSNASESVDSSGDRSDMLIDYERPIGRAGLDFEMPAPANPESDDFATVSDAAFSKEAINDLGDPLINVSPSRFDLALNFENAFG